MVLFGALSTTVLADGGATLNLPKVVLQDVSFEVTATSDSEPTLRIAGESYEAEQTDEGWAFPSVTIPTRQASTAELLVDGTVVATDTVTALAGWQALLPSLTAFVLALLIRQVIPALFVGIWLGAALTYGGTTGTWNGLLDAISVYAVGAVTDASHTSLIMFTFMIGGLVGLIARNGGTDGIVDGITRWASDARRGQWATFLMGGVVFF